MATSCIARVALSNGQHASMGHRPVSIPCNIQFKYDSFQYLRILYLMSGYGAYEEF
jgi:hypothetical protein